MTKTKKAYAEFMTEAKEVKPDFMIEGQSQKAYPSL